MQGVRSAAASEEHALRVPPSVASCYMAGDEAGSAHSCVSARRSHADVTTKFKSKYKLLLARPPVLFTAQIFVLLCPISSNALYMFPDFCPDSFASALCRYYYRGEPFNPNYYFSSFNTLSPRFTWETDNAVAAVFKEYIILRE